MRGAKRSGCTFGGEIVGEAPFLIGRKLDDLVLPVAEQESGDHTEHDCRRAFDGEYPLPAVQTQHARQHAAHDARDCDASIENQGAHGTSLRRKSVDQAKHDVLEKSRLEQAEQKAQHLKVLHSRLKSSRPTRRPSAPSCEQTCDGRRTCATAGCWALRTGLSRRKRVPRQGSTLCR